MDKKKKLFYDANKIFIGLCIFMGLIVLPLVYNLALGSGGKGGKRPVLQKAADSQPAGSALKQALTGRKDCLMTSAARMREEHMDALNVWRDEYVRDGKVLHKGKFDKWPGSNKPIHKSLSKTCLGCHADKTKFCDRCHDYAGVKPYCWECHVVPGGRN